MVNAINRKTAMKLKKGKIPLYHQLEDILRRRILKGELTPAAPFPSDAKLCKDYGVSRITVRQALKIMEDNGLIKREQGKGTFVLPKPKRTYFYEVSGSLDKAFEFSEGGKIKLKSKTQIKADPQIADDLGVKEKENIFRFEGRQIFTGHLDHVQYLEVYTTNDIGKKISISEDKKPQFYLVLEKVSLETAVQFNQIIYAMPAEEPVASVVHVPVGSPLLVIKHIFLTKNQKVLGVVIRYAPGNAYQIIHKMKLKKNKS